VAWTRAALALIAAGVVALALVSGGSSADPRTPAGPPGMPAPFLGTAVVGSGGLTAAIDAYGDVVDLRAPGPAGPALIDNPAKRQAAGTVAADTGLVTRVRVDGGPALPPWRADSVAQRYLPGTNVVRTVARFGPVRVSIVDAAFGQELARILTVSSPRGEHPRLSFGVDLEPGANCRREMGAGRVTLVCGTDGADSAPAARIVARAIAADRRWLAVAEPLGAGAPAWARGMYRRSLLTLRALTDRRTGAVAAGARDGWAYVWPRDAGTAALAFAAAGYRPDDRRVAHFLLGLDLGAAARFHGDGAPVTGRGAQGDAAGWVAVAAVAAGLPSSTPSLPWRNRADYQEGEPATYLANAIAASTEPPADGPKSRARDDISTHRPRVEAEFGTRRGLVRRAGDSGSGLDAAAAWAVRPFPHPALFPVVGRTLLRLAATQTRFGITPGEAWAGADPWTAPTAWTAWSLAALGERAQALRLLGDLRRAATPAGALPERVDAQTGIPVSTTPLMWSHAFAVLALRQLWP
jgi:hypothetical protein